MLSSLYYKRAMNMLPTLASRSIARHHKILHLIPKLVVDNNPNAQKGLEANLAYITHYCFPWYISVWQL
jgi:hypothetical protein